MGRRAELLGGAPGDDSDVIAVVARAFDVMRCFHGNGERLANSEVARRCSLPRSTVSRLTHTLTRLGHLVYLPDDQKYRIGPAAIAQSTAMLRDAPGRTIARHMIEQLAQEISGTVGLTCPDGVDMVYLECARAYDAVALSSTVGTRISVARTASGQALAAAISLDEFEALAKRVERVDAKEAALMRTRIVANRRSLRLNGYVMSNGIWHPLISGIGVPVWSERYGTWLVLTCGVLGSMYSAERLRKAVAPRLKQAAAVFASFDLDAEPIAWPTPSRASAEKTETFKERLHELGPGAGRTRKAQVARGENGGRRKGQASA